MAMKSSTNCEVIPASTAGKKITIWFNIERYVSSTEFADYNNELLNVLFLHFSLPPSMK